MRDLTGTPADLCLFSLALTTGRNPSSISSFHVLSDASNIVLEQAPSFLFLWRCYCCTDIGHLSFRPPPLFLLTSALPLFKVTLRPRSPVFPIPGVRGPGSPSEVDFFSGFLPLFLFPSRTPLLGLVPAFPLNFDNSRHLWTQELRPFF